MHSGAKLLILFFVINCFFVAETLFLVEFVRVFFNRKDSKGAAKGRKDTDSESKGASHLPVLEIKTSYYSLDS